MRALVLFLTVIVGVYLTVFIANWGGELDKSRKLQIQFEVTTTIYADPAYKALPKDQVLRLIEERIQREYQAQKLDQPFLTRSFGYMMDAVSLDLGRSEQIVSDTSSRQVRQILLDRLPSTLVLIGTAQLLLFFMALFMALFLSRRYGSFLDRLTIALAPTSAAPGWFYGLFLILIFAAALRILPWGGMIDAPVPDTSLGYGLSLLRHIVLPASAIVIGALFASIYSWRTFFLIYSSEDYVELARAKGLSSQAIERRYILRPTLPPIITTFALMIITVWMGMIILETVFDWPGIGKLFYLAIQLHDTPVIVGTIVIFGYLLAATVFMLDFVYATLDPRVRVSATGGG
jgi:peptide/nickel transport system permease protein